MLGLDNAVREAGLVALAEDLGTKVSVDEWVEVVGLDVAFDFGRLTLLPLTALTRLLTAFVDEVRERDCVAFFARLGFLVFLDAAAEFAVEPEAVLRALLLTTNSFLVFPFAPFLVTVVRVVLDLLVAVAFLFVETFAATDFALAIVFCFLLETAALESSMICCSLRLAPAIPVAFFLPALLAAVASASFARICSLLSLGPSTPRQFGAPQRHSWTFFWENGLKFELVRYV